MSGFTAERGIGRRAWIKTDATIAGGNSGGLAANRSGQLIGVPTIVSSGAGSDVVDCRDLADTNKDGTIDDRDDCVPVGGFINGIRPVDLAVPLIDAAESGSTYVSPYGAPIDESAVETDDVAFTNLVFSDGVDAGRPVEGPELIPPGATEVCAFWDYDGMTDGLRWDALWFIDGELSEGGSVIDQRWVVGRRGETWVCITNEAGLDDGLYELILAVEGEHELSDSVSVGDQQRVKIELTNDLDDDICFVYLSPTEETNWGEDELEPRETIAVGDTRSFFISAGMYDVRLEDCDERRLFQRFDQDFFESASLSVS